MSVWPENQASKGPHNHSSSRKVVLVMEMSSELTSFFPLYLLNRNVYSSGSFSELAVTTGSKVRELKRVVWTYNVCGDTSCKYTAELDFNLISLCLKTSLLHFQTVIIVIILRNMCLFFNIPFLI